VIPNIDGSSNLKKIYDENPRRLQKHIGAIIRCEALSNIYNYLYKFIYFIFFLLSLLINLGKYMYSSLLTF